MCRRRHNSDNGSEFINWHLLRWCEAEQITFTRSRSGNSNDGAHVEQKNWAIVRTVVGYHRYDTPPELLLLNRVGRLGHRLEVLVLLSGPNLSERGFNHGTAVMRLGNRANSSLGRFTRLWIRNIVGLLTPPGDTDMAGIGQSFHVAMAEDDAMTDAAGWPSCREEWGYRRQDLVVAVQGVVGVSAPIYTSGSTPTSHLHQLASCIAGCSGHLAGLAARRTPWTPLLAMNPAVAQVFGNAGLTKDDVRIELGRHAVSPFRVVDDGLAALGHRRLDEAETMASYRLSDDPERLVPVLPDPAQLAIVVTGNPGRNQSKYYLEVLLADRAARPPRLPRRRADSALSKEDVPEPL